MGFHVLLFLLVLVSSSVTVNVTSKTQKYEIYSQTDSTDLSLSLPMEFPILSSCEQALYYLKGPKAGTQDVFVDGLPGKPDNIRPNGKGGFYISLYAPPDQVILCTGRLPLVRKLVFRLHWISLKILELIGSIQIFSGDLLNGITFYVTNFGSSPVMASSPTVVEVDGDGNIINGLHADKRKHEIIQVSEFSRGEKYAYLGSFAADKIWKIPVSELP